MNIEARVGALGQRLEVSVDGVLGSGPEGVFDHGTEVVQGVRVVGESDNMTHIFSPLLQPRITLPELVAVLVLLVHVHEVVQGDQVGLVVNVEDAGLDVLDVAAVVVDVVGWRLPVSEDVVVVPVK